MAHQRWGWTLLSTCPARPCSTWKANSKVELSQAFAEWKKKSNLHTQGSLLPQNYYLFEIFTS